MRIDPNMQRQELVGVVLCGGMSSRMGIDKATLHDDKGQSFLQRSIQILEPLVQSVVVLSSQTNIKAHQFLLCEQQQKKKTAWIHIHADVALQQTGPLRALADASLHDDAWQKKHLWCVAKDTILVVISVDMPLLSTQMLTSLVHAHIAHAQAAQPENQEDHSNFAVYQQEQIQPIPVVMSMYGYSALCTDVKNGEVSLYRAIRKRKYVGIKTDDHTDRQIKNINTPEDYQAYRRLFMTNETPEDL